MAKTRQKPIVGQDEADIVEELGAKPVDPDDPAGPLIADEAAVREAGAVDVESIRANRMSAEAVNRKNGGDKNVTINEPLLEKYETVLKMWPVNTLVVLVKRLTGSPLEWTITSQPKTATELYNAIRALHGRSEETTYDVTIRDSYRKERRGSGRITLPDTRDEAPPPTPQPAQPQPGQPPMSPYYPPQPQYAPPPQAVYQTPPVGYAPQPQPQMAAAAPPPMAAMDYQAFMSLQQQQFEMWQRAQQQGHGQAAAAAAPQPQPQPAPQPVPVPVPVPVVAPQPPGVTGMDFQAFMSLQQQQFEMWQRAQQQGSAAQQPAPPPAAAQPPALPQIPGMFQVPGFGLVPLEKLLQALGVGGGTAQAPTPQQPPTAQAAQTLGMPPIQPPPGTMFVPGFGFVAVDKLVQAIGGGPAPGPVYRGPGPGYRGGPGRYPAYPGGAGEYPPDGQPPPPYAPGYPQAHQPPQRPKTMAEQFEEAAAVIDLASSLADRFRPPAAPEPAAVAAPEPDDSPIKVIDTGPAKVVINRHDGSARLWETSWANSDKIFKWLGDRHAEIQEAAAKREAAKRQQQLPPGYVEVGPGYQPPPGFVAVPVDQIPGAPAPQHALPQSAPPSPLPPPPARMPPPLAPQAPPQPRTWDIPGVP
jgi:hypothetical protein